MVPSRFQLPPASHGAAAKAIAGPPDASIVFSLLSAKNPSARLSGDQNGSVAPSVPGSGRVASESRERIQSSVFPVSSAAQKARACPSGEITGVEPVNGSKLN